MKYIFLLVFYTFQLFSNEKGVLYPNFDDNILIKPHMKEAIWPHLLPLSHPIKPLLDAIFSTERVTNSLESLRNAGFEILFVKEVSFIIVAKHPLMKGYLLKMYVDSNFQTKRNIPSWRWLVNRCIGAKRLKKIIQKHAIKNFTVPEKWIYPLPPLPTEGMAHPVILVVEEMNLTTRKETRIAWKTKVTPEHLEELLLILTKGCGSNLLVNNVPYTKEGKFTFIDTENLNKKSKLVKVKQFISPELHPYWNQLTKGY